LVWEIFFKSKKKVNVDTRVVRIVFAGILTLAVPGFVIYQISIILGTLFQGTAPIVFNRSTGLAALLGLIWGIVWARFLFPWLVATATEEGEDNEHGEPE